MQLTMTPATLQVPILVISAFITVCQSDEDSLLLVNMVYRHGSRAPMESFPLNPIPISAWSQGLRSLTQEGMRQHRDLGSYMRKRYSGFINDSYTESEIYVRSTDTSRTLTSAAAHLSGMFPPSKFQLWDPHIPWQPIPIHTMPSDLDTLFGHASCPTCDNTVASIFASEETKKFAKKYQTLFEFLTEKTGMDVNIETVHIIRDALYCQHYNNFSDPEWYNTTVAESLHDIRTYLFDQKFNTIDVPKLGGGLVVKEMIDSMLNKTDHVIPMSKIFMYSAHDTTVTSVLTIMGNRIYDIPYAAVVMVELHRTSDGYIVRVFFKGSDDKVTAITPKGCSPDCPLNEFISLTKKYIPQNWQRECGIQEFDFLSSHKLFGVICGLGGAIMSALLIGTIVGIAFIARHKSPKHKYHTVSTEMDYQT